MADTISPEKRSEVMSRIRGRNTKPEMIIRRGLHARGYRYGLHNKRLSGRPDLALPKYRAVIFVHGCFWHKHDCNLFRWPKTRKDFWKNKLGANQARDVRNLAELRKLGWRVCVVWECAMRGQPLEEVQQLLECISDWLKGSSVFIEFRS